ncbi:MAG: Haloacid dehalogenase domain protein hydrolase [Myxococcales bacterium]|nr:Haloacid dehalogenase domain protein hydrolase [Myxococcales bacterium]
MTVLYLFDIDGTLLDAHGSGRGAFDAVFAEHHGIANASEGIRYGGKTDPAIVEEIFLARMGRAPTAAEHAAFVEAYLPRLRSQLAAQGVRVLEGVVATLELLARLGHVRLGVATGNIRAGADAKLAAAGLHPWFELGGYGCDSPKRAELVATAIERGRARGEVREVVVVGDTIHDIAAARACGATVCAVATGSDSADKLRDADVVFRTMSELPAWHAARFG